MSCAAKQIDKQRLALPHALGGITEWSVLVVPRGEGKELSYRWRAPSGGTLRLHSFVIIVSAALAFDANDECRRSEQDWHTRIGVAFHLVPSAQSQLMKRVCIEMCGQLQINLLELAR